MHKALIWEVWMTICQILRAYIYVTMWVMPLSCAQQKSLLGDSAPSDADIAPKLLAGRESAPRLLSQVISPRHAVSYWLNTWGGTRRIHLLICINPDKMQICPSSQPPACFCRPDLTYLDHFLWRKLEALHPVSSNVGKLLFGEGVYCGSYIMWEKLSPTWVS